MRFNRRRVAERDYRGCSRMLSPMTTTRVRRFVECAALATFLLWVVGCKDQGKASEQKATEHVAQLAQLTDRDVGEVERGLPVGATQLASLFANGADPQKDLSAVRHGLKRIRAEIPDLTVAKSTFFALTDAHGVAIRNDLDVDVMAGMNVVSIFPSLSKALEGGFVTTTGVFPGAPPPSGPDRDWMAAAPVKDPSSRQVVGLLVTGWTFRRFCIHLQESLRHDLQEQLLEAKDNGKLPILYVAVFDPTGLYTAPLTPSVNEKALVDIDLLAKTASGPIHGVVNITDRDFGYAALRVPKLGMDTGIAVLRSEI
jgi:hypothetical protein